VGLPKVLTLRKTPYVPRAAPRPVLRVTTTCSCSAARSESSPSGRRRINSVCRWLGDGRASVNASAQGAIAGTSGQASARDRSPATERSGARSSSSRARTSTARRDGARGPAAG
jgi:hypothetical protein